MTEKTIQYIKRIKDAFSNKNIDYYDYSLITDIPNAHSKIPVKCLKHNEIFYSRVDHLLGGFCGCKKCKSINYHNSKDTDADRFNKLIAEQFNTIEILSKYINNNIKIKFKCNNCNTIFYRRPRNMVISLGCPSCNSVNSHLEQKIINLLNKKDIQYKYQYSFEWLGRKTLDFYIPKYNVAIECQGLQHFISKSFFGGEKGLKIIMERDREKFQLCKDNNVKLLYYADYDYDFPYDVITNEDELINNIIKL